MYGHGYGGYGGYGHHGHGCCGPWKTRKAKA
ncbi:hypothetical protein ANCDUO_08890 [Ancylostoma duodenale]|uniref:Uncharacterized protein n=1 Tax=Ancylostoma duodenale TaxID=51022 RepID=A0A0C2CVF6_9BILA|nr:hypothetical protein ANCDUO_08890 [Ancylostoma duodenale]